MPFFLLLVNPFFILFLQSVFLIFSLCFVDLFPLFIINWEFLNNFTLLI